MIVNNVAINYNTAVFPVRRYCNRMQKKLELLIDYNTIISDDKHWVSYGNFS